LKALLRLLVESPMRQLEMVASLVFPARLACDAVMWAAAQSVGVRGAMYARAGASR